MRFIALFLVIVSISGCVLQDEYPSEWGDISGGNEGVCPDISGTYMNSAMSTLEGAKEYLGSILLPDNPKGYSAEKIRISILKEHDQVKVELINNDTETSRETISIPSEFKCDEGTYTIYRREFVNKEGAIGKQWLSFKFYSNIDSLIASKKKGIAGTLFFVPLAGTETHWLRFVKP